METDGRKTTVEHWDSAWTPPVSLRLPSGLDAAVGDLQRLLRRHVRANQKYLEIGCAPGKLLCWVAGVLKAEVAGLDFSPRGLEQARRLFEGLGLRADLRCEDLFSTTFQSGTFDVVCSFGFIEHFNDPLDVVRKHVVLLKPGGLALIAVPNYGGLYGVLQNYFDPPNLELHNLRIMHTTALSQLAPVDLVNASRAYREGRISPWLVSFHKKWPSFIAKGAAYAINAAALLQPVKVRPLCSMLVLEMTKKEGQ
ncbi:MAG TPA: class I SAM-dependent methyltransferase [Candidatus Sulfotelmatobacter sp.]|nr:class I SAM-dependent methyltransferase [Candidatus Sulfotelmatobacter sp.]